MNRISVTNIDHNFSGQEVHREANVKIFGNGDNDKVASDDGIFNSCKVGTDTFDKFSGKIYKIW